MELFYIIMNNGGSIIMLLFICNSGIPKVTSLYDKNYTLIDNSLDHCYYDGVYIAKEVRYTLKGIRIIKPITKVCSFKSEYLIRKILPFIEDLYNEDQIKIDLYTLRLIKGILNQTISLDLGSELLDMIKGLYQNLNKACISCNVHIKYDDASLLRIIFKIIKKILLDYKKSEILLRELASVLNTPSSTANLKFVISSQLEEVVKVEDADKIFVEVIFSNLESKSIPLLNILNKYIDLCINYNFKFYDSAYIVTEEVYI